MVQTGQQIGAGPGDTRRPSRWTLHDKLAVWGKASPIPGKDETKVRRDVAGFELHWDDYGKDTVGQLSTTLCFNVSVLTVA